MQFSNIDKLIIFIVPVFEPNTSSLAMHVVGLAPLKDMVMKTMMQVVVLLLSHLDNELNELGDRNSGHQRDFIDFEVHDFTHGLDRRITMLVANSFLLNTPANFLNGKLLEKLTNASKFKCLS